jgi:group I intron endonuclease
MHTPNLPVGESSGVYIIRCREDGRVYVGSSAMLRRRLNHHACTLRNKTHHNRHLSEAWELYGEDGFEFVVLEHVEDASALVVREQHYIDAYQSHIRRYGFNVDPEAGLVQGQKLVEERRRNISLGHLGICPTEEHKKKISNAQRKLSPEQVATVRIRIAEGRRLKDIAAEVGCSGSTIFNVKHEKRLAYR